MKILELGIFSVSSNKNYVQALASKYVQSDHVEKLMIWQFCSMGARLNGRKGIVLYLNSATLIQIY